MAKIQKTVSKVTTDTAKRPVPNFKDVDKSATQAAQAAVQGGRQDPLTVPSTANVSQDQKGTTYSRWTERSSVQQAYRSVTKNGLLDVTVVVKLRQSPTEKNNGRKVFSHFYINNQDEVPEKHENMNERSIGSIVTLLVATGYMPAGGALKGSMLDKMFPQKGQPGTASPLVGKSVVTSIVQTKGAKKDIRTGKIMKDDDGNIVIETRDSGETFLPDTVKNASVDEDEEESEEEE
jgi:hypothetical protein